MVHFSRLAKGIAVLSAVACQGYLMNAACSSSPTGGLTATEVAIDAKPDAVTLRTSQTQQFTVADSLSDGSVHGGISATWQATGGTITTGGLYEAGSTPGAYIVIATSAAGHHDTSQVTIVAASLVSITLAPATATVQAQGTVQFSVTGHFDDGSSGSVNASYSAPTGGSINAAGLYTAPAAAGSYQVIATVGALADTSTVTVTATGPSGYVYPLKVSANARYLVDQNNKPFLITGDAPWSLIAQLSVQDANTYLTNRQQLGFNTIIVSLIEHKFATNAPADIAGFAPFAGTAFTTAENEAYFVRADSIIQLAAQKGIVVLLAPVYLGYGCGDEGWCAEVEAASVADMTAWGQYVGNRYKTFKNIIWLIGGDTDPSQSAALQSRVQAVVDGILSKDTGHLFTAHNAPEQYAITPWGSASWLNINDVYSYTSTMYSKALTAYNHTPTMPFFLIESAYENEGASAQELRAQSYWTVLTGGFGHTFGNCPIWELGASVAQCPETDWQGALNDQGSLNMQHFQQLFNSRHWYSLVPDVNNVALTAGYGSGTSFATAAYATDSSSIIIYTPVAQQLTVSGSRLVGTTMTAWWYNPATGVATSIGSFPTTGTQNFTPPSGGDGDWVLVIDSQNFGFAAPGQ
jgi:hypothetical protein